MARIQAVKGFNDILPSEALLREQVFTVLRQCLKHFSYQEVILPLLEQTALYKRSIGQVTDIVAKEMYTFQDLNGDDMSLRPEGTAGCVRAAIEHGLLRQSQKWWYCGPMFRHEKPQKGRYRQFYQLGVEVFGVADLSAELELLLLVEAMWQALDIRPKLKLQLNCLGQSVDRESYKQALVSYFWRHQACLTSEEQERLQRNPLRLLDSKSEHIQSLLHEAPRLSDYLSSVSQQNFEMICRSLDALNIQYTMNPYLVRGLDYYNDLVFEWVSEELGSQGTVCAGGRYDALVEQLGGPSTPGIGFALGLERLLLLLDRDADAELDIYLLTQEAQPLVKTQELACQLRQELGLSVEVHLASASFKSQFKKADKTKARIAIVLGTEELEQGFVTMKWLRREMEADKQISIPRTEVIVWLRQQFGGKIC